MNTEGLQLLERSEGVRLKAYPDPGTGGEPWTIGAGHTSAAGLPKVYRGMVITMAEAREILARDIRKFEYGVTSLLKTAINDNQFAALTVFAYNVGLGSFAKSGVLAAVNARRFDLVPSRLALYNKANHKVMPGLVRRRQEEATLFLKPVSTYAKPFMEVPATEVEPVSDNTDASVNASVDDSSNAVADEPKGKPVVESTTVLAQAGTVLTTIVTPVLGAVTGIDWKVMAVVAVALVLGFACYTVSERMRHGREADI